MEGRCLCGVVRFSCPDAKEIGACHCGFCRRWGGGPLLATSEYFIPAGTFETDAFEIATQIYIDNKPDYYAFANQTPTLTEQQVIEQYGPPEDRVQ